MFAKFIKSYFKQASESNQKTFGNCVDLFLDQNWTGANFCLSELYYRVITVNFGDEIVYGIVPRRDFMEGQGSDRFMMG